MESRRQDHDRRSGEDGDWDRARDTHSAVDRDPREAFRHAPGSHRGIDLHRHRTDQMYRQ
jgi:hypothetical protein